MPAPFLAIAATLACFSGEELPQETAEENDTAAADSPFAWPAEDAFVAGHLPAEIMDYNLILAMMYSVDDRACPEFSESGETRSLAGGCSDDYGNSWFGALDETRSGGLITLVADNWGYEYTDGRSLRVTGLQVADGSTLTSDGLHIDLTGEVPIGNAWYDGVEAPHSLDYPTHRTEGYGWMEYWDSVAGSFVLDGVNLTVSETWAWGNGCSREPVSGGVTLDDTVESATFTFDGDQHCDGCVPWTRTSGREGSFCTADAIDGDTDTG